MMASRSSSISGSISFLPSTRSWICSVKFSLVCLTASLIFSKTVGSFFFGVPNRLMNSICLSGTGEPLFFLQPSIHQILDCVMRRQTLVKDRIHFFGDRHFHVV